MSKNKLLSFFTSIPAVIFFLVISVTGIFAYSGGPPDVRTGANGGMTCIDGCHTGSELNSGGGSMSITSNIPQAGYIPDTIYTITVSISQSSVSSYGFEANALSLTGEQAGTIIVTDATNTKASTTNNITYIKHSKPASGSNGSWSFDWEAPTGDAGVATIYVAGNAANGNSAPSGDQIYAKSVSFSPDLTTDVESEITPGKFQLHGNYPNPFNPSTSIKFELERTSRVILKIYDITGREVRSLVSGQLTSGVHEMKWNGLNNNGRQAATGTYILRLTAGGRTATSKMLLIK